MISNMMKAGALVPGEIPCRLIKAAMEKQGWAAKKFLIDGFPRNQDNYKSWQAVMGDSIDLAGILHFVVDEEQLTARILKRAETSGRADDNIETLRKRFATYKNEQIPVITMFEQQGNVKNINGMQDIETVYAEVISTLAANKRQILV